MYSLDVIKSINARAVRAPETNFNRNSSFCRSLKGYVLHSGSERSTVFVSEIEHPECFRACRIYFRRAGAEARNGFIEAIVAGCDPTQARRNGRARARRARLTA